MKKISFWAKHNKWSARFIIIAIYILLNIVGITVGSLFNNLQISIPTALLLFSIFLFIIGVIFYPEKEKVQQGNSSYRRQKSFDFILGFSSFCLIVYAGNHEDNIVGNFTGIKAAVSIVPSLSVDSTKNSYQSILAFKEAMKDANEKNLVWKEKKILLKKQIKEIKSAKEMSVAGKIILIILSVMVAFGLLLLLAALSCSIYCGGAGTLALIVALLGTGVILWILIRVIRSIVRKKYKKSKVNVDSKVGMHQMPI